MALAEDARRVLLFDADYGLANADLLLGLVPGPLLDRFHKTNVQTLATGVLKIGEHAFANLVVIAVDQLLVP